jgi:NADPH-dependent F420 reductase
LAYRFAKAGLAVTIGSRNRCRAQAVARQLAERAVSTRVTGTDNASACQRTADAVVLAVPYAGHAELVSDLASLLDRQIVVSCVNPLGFDKLGPFGLVVDNGSAAEEAQQIVPGAKVVGAFHHVSAVNLWNTEGHLEDDVLVCGDDAAAKAIVADLARHISGRQGIDVGGLRLARQLEPLTSVLISLNKRHRVHAGIRIAGLVSA